MAQEIQMSDYTPTAIYTFNRTWLPAVVDSSGNRHEVPGAMERYRRRDAIACAARHIAAVEAEIDA